MGNRGIRIGPLTASAGAEANSGVAESLGTCYYTIKYR